jgi:hypothetical protein
LHKPQSIYWPGRTWTCQLLKKNPTALLQLLQFRFTVFFGCAFVRGHTAGSTYSWVDIQLGGHTAGCTYSWVDIQLGGHTAGHAARHTAGPLHNGI